MKRFFFLVVAGILLLSALSACETPVGSSGGTLTPTSVPTMATSPTGPSTPSPTASSSASQAVVMTATQFYNLIQARDYTRAYTYLDVHATDPNGQVFTRQSFEQQAQARDSEAGAVVSFSVSAFTSMVVATVTRSQLGPYHAHLQMKQEGNTWKVLSLDRI